MKEKKNSPFTEEELREYLQDLFAKRKKERTRATPQMIFRSQAQIDAWNEAVKRAWEKHNLNNQASKPTDK